MFGGTPSRQARGMDTEPNTSTFPEAPDGAPGPTYTTVTDDSPEERLHRAGEHRMLAGVAGGLADYFDVDPTMVRIGFVALAFLGGLAVPLYLAGWLLIPDEGAEESLAEELIARERR